MSTFDEMKQLISAYIDGEVSAEERQTAEQLLATSPEAKKYHDELRKLSSSLHAWNDESLSPDLAFKLNKEYCEKKKEEGLTMKATERMGIKVASTLAVMLIVVVTTQLYTQRQRQGRLRSATDDIGATLSTKTEGMPQLAQSLTSLGGSSVMDKSSQLVLASNREETQTKSFGRTQKIKDEQLASAKKTVTITDSEQYEPYFLETNYEIRRTDAGASTVKTFADTSSSVSLGVTLYPVYPVPGTTDGNTEQYDRIIENEYLNVTQNPVSTFSIDVDTASYSNIRRFLENNQMPPEDSVRVEEMINYFSYEYPEPTEDEPFSITTEIAACPWNTDHTLALVGLQGKRLKGDEMPPSNLVFLIDVSGSMSDENKLPLLKHGFKMMVQQLRPTDTVSIVVYASATGQVLTPTSGDQKYTILSAIDRLQSGGSTAGAAGIQLAYELAKQNFKAEGNNRVILATDGDFNVGMSDDGSLVRMIEEKRKDGIFLTILGFGMGNYKDSRMEKIADAGNGNYYYIDSIREAKKVLVSELGSALFTIAKDVKVQIEFNPAQVKAYRLVGYETRMLKKEDFNNDAKDAGELGTGHTVTALYEIIPAGSEEAVNTVDDLKYQTTTVKQSDDLMTVKLRYKKPDEDVSKLTTTVVTASEIKTGTTSNNFNWASAVAEFGMILRNSKFKGTASYGETVQRAQNAKGADTYGYRQEMIDLIQTAEQIDMRNLSSTGGISTK